MKALWFDRYFTVGRGWSNWQMKREVEFLAETPNAWKISYKNWRGKTVVKWVSRNSTKLEKIEEQVK